MTKDKPFSTLINEDILKRIKRVSKKEGIKIKHLTETGFMTVLKEYERN